MGCAASVSCPPPPNIQCARTLLVLTQVVRTHRDVEKKAILQMEVATVTPQAVQAQPQPVLLSLTEDGVNVRSLPDAMLRCQVRRALSHMHTHTHTLPSSQSSM